ncbi:hypothetical protein F751_5880 [Auxenochlorella protothecoides]|uniref:Uncharacterized protein n=1 Tax=Auxenochlorella protothecoides TaxID=3075 RepID=A0A087SMU4_AUXPR|nr:hypothetical protein F751_5880 [Auxenochlorella protothecoides]KFM27048.1 hypothetical protein F751_5880 [Auxenochlorella protothecoides]
MAEVARCLDGGTREAGKKYWKGDHIISVTQKIIEEHMRSIANQKTIDIDVSRLHWTPYGKLDGRR